MAEIKVQSSSLNQIQSAYGRVSRLEAIITFANSTLYHPFLMLQSLKEYNVYLIRILYMSIRHMSGKCYYTALHKKSCC